MSKPVPQAIVTLSPEGGLQIEQSIHGVRKLVPLTLANAGKTLDRILKAQRANADDAAKQRAKRAPSQPDWELIAKHPQVEIRRMLPGRGVGTREQAIPGKSLEDLGL